MGAFFGFFAGARLAPPPMNPDPFFEVAKLVWMFGGAVVFSGVFSLAAMLASKSDS